MGKGTKILKAAGAAGVAAVSVSTAAAGILFGKFVKRPAEYEDLGVTPLDAYKDMIEEGIAWFKAQNPEIWKMRSFDGLLLHGRFLPCENARGTLLLMHGYRSPELRDFSCVFRFYHENGFNILVADQRANGNSEGGYSTFGVREREDCKDWCWMLRRRLGADLPIFMDGVSMGGTTVLMSTALVLPENVKGIIADCGFTSPWDIMTHVLKKWYKMGPFPILHIAGIMARKKAGFGPKDASTIEAMKTNKIPVLFVHGADDDFVPVWMTEKNYEACAAPKEMHIIEGAGHGMSYMTEMERCQKAILAFIERYS